MSLKRDIEEAYMKALEVDRENKGNIPQLAEDLTDAIVKFLQKQTFTITNMESVLRVEEIKTTGTLKADVLDDVEVKTENIKSRTPTTYGGVMNGNVTRKSGKEGVKIPKLDLKLSNGQGGALTAVGHSYIGNNPVDSRERNNEHGDNKVKLLKVVSDK
jgi:hypothetical protein